MASMSCGEWGYRHRDENQELKIEVTMLRTEMKEMKKQLQELQKLMETKQSFLDFKAFKFIEEKKIRDEESERHERAVTTRRQYEMLIQRLKR